MWKNPDETNIEKTLEKLSKNFVARAIKGCNSNSSLKSHGLTFHWLESTSQ